MANVTGEQATRTSFLAWVLGVGAVGGAVAWWWCYRASPRRLQGPRNKADHAEDDIDIDIPEEFQDPISLSVIKDPVLLCATGQVYCAVSIRDWFKTGNRLCPRTNLEILDVQLTKMPTLKSKIQDWCRQNGVPLPEEDTRADLLNEMHPSLSSWVADIRSDSSQKRIRAVANLYELMRTWEMDAERQQATTDAEVSKRQFVRELVMDDMVWLLRYGDSYLQGVAASMLSYSDTPEEVQWLAATASIPAVALCLSPNNYTSQAATRLLFNIARAGPNTRRALRIAGAAKCILSIVSCSREEYGYSRDRAAATLALLAKDAEMRTFLHQYSLRPLKRMLLESEDRWEKRDAATSLLALQYTEDELTPEVTTAQLFDYLWCSRAWLEGRASSPTEGYSPEEETARAGLAFWREHADVLDPLARDLVHVNNAIPAGEEAEPGDDEQEHAVAV